MVMIYQDLFSKIIKQSMFLDERLELRASHFAKAIIKKKGGFKFQVQRVNEGAVPHRLPRAWQSSDIFVGAC